MRSFTMLSPGVQAVVDDEARQVFERGIGGSDRCAVYRRSREHLAGRLHGGLLYEWHLVLLHDLTTPGVDLLVDVDLHRTDVGAAAVERRSERQIAVLAGIEGGIDDDADGPGISGAVTQSAAAPIDRAGVHAGATADALERGPELFHAEPRRAAVVDQHEVHLAPFARTAEV